MKDGDLIVSEYELRLQTRRYWPLDKVARRIREGRMQDSLQCRDPKIMFPVVYYTAEMKWGEN